MTEHHSDYDPLIPLKCSELTVVVILPSIFLLFRIDQKYTNKSSRYTLQGEVCLLAQSSPPHLLWKPEYKKMNTD